jgi:DNA-binding response OmpR family regulator
LRRVELDGPRAGRAAAGAADDDDAPIVRGPLAVNATTHIATLDGAPLDLTPREFDLLRLFAAHPGRAFSREYLVEHLWGYDYDGFDRTVDSHITRLRRKLGPLGERIVTVWGVGYRFMP